MIAGLHSEMRWQVSRPVLRWLLSDPIARTDDERVLHHREGINLLANVKITECPIYRSVELLTLKEKKRIYFFIGIYIHIYNIS